MHEIGISFVVVIHWHSQLCSILTQDFFFVSGLLWSTLQSLMDNIPIISFMSLCDTHYSICHSIMWLFQCIITWLIMWLSCLVIIDSTAMFSIVKNFYYYYNVTNHVCLFVFFLNIDTKNYWWLFNWKKYRIL